MHYIVNFWSNIVWVRNGETAFLTEVDGTDLLSFLDLLFVAARLFNHIQLGNIKFELPDVVVCPPSLPTSLPLFVLLRISAYIPGSLENPLFPLPFSPLAAFLWDLLASASLLLSVSSSISSSLSCWQRRVTYA